MDCCLNCPKKYGCCDQDVGLSIIEFDELSSSGASFVRKDGIWHIKADKTHPCFFFDIKTKKCKIYESRPLRCRIYPMIEGSADLYAAEKPFGLDSDCPQFHPENVDLLKNMDKVRNLEYKSMLIAYYNFGAYIVLELKNLPLKYRDIYFRNFNKNDKSKHQALFFIPIQTYLSYMDTVEKRLAEINAENDVIRLLKKWRGINCYPESKKINKKKFGKSRNKTTE